MVVSDESLMDEDKRTILQIIPVVGWEAEMQTPNGNQQWSIICWALIRVTDRNDPNCSFETVKGLCLQDGQTDLVEVDEDLPEGYIFLRYAENDLT